MEQASNSVVCLVHYFVLFCFSLLVSGNKTWIFTTEKAVPEAYKWLSFPMCFPMWNTVYHEPNLKCSKKRKDTFKGSWHSTTATMYLISILNIKFQFCFQIPISASNPVEITSAKNFKYSICAISWPPSLALHGRFPPSSNDKLLAALLFIQFTVQKKEQSFTPWKKSWIPTGSMAMNGFRERHKR